jgi:hypothetical protein
MAEGVGFRVHVEANISPLYVIQTGYGTHSASIPWVPRSFSLGVKRARRAADHSPATRSEIKNMWI